MYRELQWLIKPNGRWLAEAKAWEIPNEEIRVLVIDFVHTLARRVWTLCKRLREIRNKVDYGPISLTYLLDDETAPMYPNAKIVNATEEEKKLWQIYQNARVVSVR